ncbi:MAG: insulinase family protein [Helicobacteraceae bacterium]|nr:insulinase family protein [Helicobacteraceae bacterium]
MANSLPEYKTLTLDNGLEIYVIEMENNSNVISTDIFYKVGSRNEVMGKSGIAHMLEHMNFKSTKNLKAGEFDERVKSIGGSNNASTGFDITHYYIKSSTPNLGNSLELFAELMQNLKLTDSEFQSERDVVAEERRWRTDNNPSGYLYFRTFNNTYIYHPYHWMPIGFMGDILTWTLEDIKSFHKKYYQPQNAILIVSGDVKAEDVFKQAKEQFGKIKNSGEIPKVLFVEPEQDGAKEITVYKDSEVEMLSMTFHIPNFEDEDQPALSAISEILSSGKSSRLYKVLVDEKQMVNQVYGYNMENKDPGVFIFFATCNPGVKAKDVKKVIIKEIEKLKSEKVTNKELNRVKINTKADFIYSLENSTSVANLFGSYLARGSLKPLLEYEDKINTITPKEILKVAKKHFNFKHSTTVILKKEKSKKETNKEEK